jgi:hypothetical protein
MTGAKSLKNGTTAIPQIKLEQKRGMLPKWYKYHFTRVRACQEMRRATGAYAVTMGQFN